MSPQASPGERPGIMREWPAITIRRATAADAQRLELLAQLDEDVVPAAPLLLAFAADELWAAVSLTDGAVIADPFRPSGEVAALARERARQLTLPLRRRRRVSFWRIRRPRLAPSGSN